MEGTSKILTIGFMNIRGQTGLTSAKQAQIESFLTQQKLDVLHQGVIFPAGARALPTGNPLISQEILIKATNKSVSRRKKITSNQFYPSLFT